MIAVDNASTDDTPSILRSFQSRLPMIVLRHPVAGKNAALNLVLDIIPFTAELYIFTDDDAIPDADFLRRWEDVLGEQRDADLFGGVVRPCFTTAPPAWLRRYSGHFGALYAQVDRPGGAIEPASVFGPNMAVRGSVLAAGHRFNDRIGPNSGNADYPMGSETEFCVRICAASGRLAWFAPGPAVRHIVRPHQMTREFIERRAYRHGRGVAMRQALAREGFRLHRPGLKATAMQGLLWLAMRVPVGEAWWDFHWRRGYCAVVAEHRGGR
jgi:glycosyltransferase involved in cell wall biosynthesis